MFWKPQRPAKHFFPLLECTCHTNQLTRVQTRVTGDANLLPADRGGGSPGLSGWGSPGSRQSLQGKASTCPGVGQKAGRPEKENPAFCLHVTIPNVCDSFQMQTENLTNFAFLSKLSPFKFLHINSA